MDMKAFSLEGKVALITGAAYGIGRRRLRHRIRDCGGLCSRRRKDLLQLPR